jgi:hypothetical protein
LDQGGVPCHQVRGLAASKLADIESHLQDVLALRNVLRESLKDWDARLAKTASGQRAGLLQYRPRRHRKTSPGRQRPQSTAGAKPSQP